MNLKTRRQNFSKNCRETSRRYSKTIGLFVPADKITNFYRISPDSYQQLLKASITKAYKKAPSSHTKTIIAEEKKIAENLKLDNRIDALAEKQCFITLKDHKPNFSNNPTTRLINPTKLEIGIISKKILERINNKVVAAIAINQWKNSDAVIN